MSDAQPIKLDGRVLLWRWPRLLGEQMARELTRELLDTLPWERPRVRVFGRDHPVPRRQSWHGNPGTRYRYSGLALEPRPWTPALALIRDRVGERCGMDFNSVLVNHYRDGNDRMGWHADNEPELGPEPWVASFSLGACRRFAFRRRGESRTLITLELEHDDLLLMAPEVQHHYQHGLPVMRRVHDSRINLTFRRVVPPAP